MINKSILASLAIVATVCVVAPASAKFPETGTAANNAEGGFDDNGYGWTVPHGQQVLINHLPDPQRRE